MPTRSARLQREPMPKRRLSSALPDSAGAPRRRRCAPSNPFTTEVQNRTKTGCPGLTTLLSAPLTYSCTSSNACWQLGEDQPEGVGVPEPLPAPSVSQRRQEPGFGHISVLALLAGCSKYPNTQSTCCHESNPWHLNHLPPLKLIPFSQWDQSLGVLCSKLETILRNCKPECFIAQHPLPNACLWAPASVFIKEGWTAFPCREGERWG